jgi:Uma2 family endonuclease
MARQAVRHEMVEGRLVMMAGGSNAHVKIAGNLLVALRNRLRGGPRRPFGSDFMVERDPRNRFYPDVSAAYGETRDWTDRPLLVAEVLSPATRRFDLSVKLPRYLACPGLRHVLYLEPDRPLARLWVPGEPPGDPAIVAGLDRRPAPSGPRPRAADGRALRGRRARLSPDSLTSTRAHSPTPLEFLE